MEKTLSKSQQDKAFQLAQDLVAQASLREIYHTLTSEIGFKHVDKIPAAIDPRSLEAEDQIKNVRSILMGRLNDEEQNLLCELEDLWWDRVFWRQLASFYLGAAYGTGPHGLRFSRKPVQLGGEEVDRGN